MAATKESWANDLFDGATLGDLEAEIDKKELEPAQKYRVRKRADLLKVTGNSEAEVDKRLGDAVLPQCYKEVKNLLWIENNVLYKKALEEWTRKEKLLTNKVERKKRKVGDLKNEIYQLIGFFSVFQGVVLTAVSQSNLLFCNNLWSPVLLSVLASIATIAGVAQKLQHIGAFLKTISSDEHSLKEASKIVNELPRIGKEFLFADYPGDKEILPEKNSLYSIFVVVYLVILTAVFPLSFWRILCHS